MLFLKWLTDRREGPHTGLPYPEQGVWTVPAVPVLCKSGWHACRWEDAVHHIDARLWVVELDGETVAGVDKVAAERLRLVEPVTAIDDRTIRLFAADCAERVLPIFEADYPDDMRPREAILAARAYADGRIDADPLAAAGYAAWAARDAAGYAARDAAWAAADAAAGAAAWAAARAAERVWQTGRLLEHYARLDPDLFTHKDAP